MVTNVSKRTASERRRSEGIKSEGAKPIHRYVSIFVRCVIEHRGGVWQGFTLEYGLAVQGISARDVQERLERMILSYVSDALIGEDRDNAEYLLSRRAHWSVYAKYYMTKARDFFDRREDNGSKDHRAYREPLALEPRLCSP